MSIIADCTNIVNMWGYFDNVNRASCLLLLTNSTYSKAVASFFEWQTITIAQNNIFWPRWFQRMGVYKFKGFLDLFLRGLKLDKLLYYLTTYFELFYTPSARCFKVNPQLCEF